MHASIHEVWTRTGRSIGPCPRAAQGRYDPAMRINRLAGETSPYLLQHAHNPVDWHPWGAEALERARAEDHPIFLSVGYSACHWCHVMERESFEDAGTAAYLNANFVSIKVDREERPDLDAIYMRAVQALTGSGGWPMTVFLTPDGRPFYGGTYYPNARRHGLPSFRDVLEGVSAAWHDAACRRRARRDGSRVVARTDRAPRPRGRAGRDRHPRCGRVRAGVRLRRRGRGLGRPDEVPPADGSGVPAAPCRVRRRPRAAAGPPNPGPDGGRGNPRPAGWRVQPLRHGAHLAGAPLREDALRQRPARAHLPPRLAADPRSGRPGRGPLHARLRGARDDPAGRRVRGEPRCGHGRRGGCDLHLDVRRDPRCAGCSRPGGGCRAVRDRVRRDRGGELGGSHDPPARGAGRGAGGSDGLPRGRGSVAPRRGPPGAPGGPGPAARSPPATTRRSPAGTG